MYGVNPISPTSKQHMSQGLVEKNFNTLHASAHDHPLRVALRNEASLSKIDRRKSGGVGFLSPAAKSALINQGKQMPGIASHPDRETSRVPSGREAYPGRTGTVMGARPGSGNENHSTYDAHKSAYEGRGMTSSSGHGHTAPSSATPRFMANTTSYMKKGGVSPMRGNNGKVIPNNQEILGGGKGMVNRTSGGWRFA